MSEIHPLLWEYQNEVWRAGFWDAPECQCANCKRRMELETIISEALECAPLIADVRAAVELANAELEQRNGGK